VSRPRRRFGQVRQPARAVHWPATLAISRRLCLGAQTTCTKLLAWPPATTISTLATAYRSIFSRNLSPELKPTAPSPYPTDELERPTASQPHNRPLATPYTQHGKLHQAWPARPCKSGIDRRLTFNRAPPRLDCLQGGRSAAPTRRICHTTSMPKPRTRDGSRPPAPTRPC
jgi:hypothetical protein